MRKIFLLLLLVWIWITSGLQMPVQAAESISTVIINQVRGDECCLPGAQDFITTLLETEQVKDLPLAWALRYDVLVSDSFTTEIKKIPDTQTTGILLEVTPRLASVSGVLYKGKADGSDWASSRNAFLIGYSQTERKKLIDTVFAEYFRQFQRYPDFPVAWMIDSWSLAYLARQYGVRVHELTKEQFETDDYTLYGGIFNIPYRPSLSHPLIPDFKNGLNLLVMRQTISDLTKNYGSYDSFYTSQTNDYRSHPDGLDIHYFEQLFTETQQQTRANAFALLGLENSTEWQQYREEYLAQLRYISEQVKNQTARVLTPFAFYNEYVNKKQESARYLVANGFPQSGTLWYFGDTYRARLEVWPEGIVLTDLRLFANLPDPYMEAAPTNRSYYVVPAILDSSQQFVEQESESLPRFLGHPVRTDSGVTRFGIRLTPAAVSLVEEGRSVILKSETEELVHFEPEFFTVQSAQDPVLTAPIGLSLSELLSINTEQFFTFARHPRFVLQPKREAAIVSIGWENREHEIVSLMSIRKTGQTWEFVPNHSVSADGLQSLAMVFQPDQAGLPIDLTTSVFYWHNREAIVNRNPVRLYVDPRNSYNRPTQIRSLNVSESPPDQVSVKLPENPEQKLEAFYIDFTASQSATTTIGLTIDGNIIEEKTEISFYPDCIRDLLVCTRDTEKLKGYIRVLFVEKTNVYRKQAEKLFLDAQRRIGEVVNKFLQTTRKLL